jgi:hypothetical protein
VVITFGAGEICIIYYMVALVGTSTPSAKELLEGGPPAIPTTLSRYGKINIGKENMANMLIDELRA